MLQGKKWLIAHPGSRVVVADTLGNHIEGFIELIDPEAGLAWIREDPSGERRMITQAEYPRVVPD